MVNYLRCPACGGYNCLPMEASFGQFGLITKIGKCEKCGIEMTNKDYFRRLRKGENEDKV